MRSLYRTGVSAFSAVSVVLALATIADASVELVPSVASICMHERTVLRAKDGRSIRETSAAEPVELVRVKICDRRRAACMVQDEEVSMSLCR